MFWGDDASSLGGTGGINTVSATVNGNVVVPPAQRGEVLHVVGASLAAGNNMVDLEPVTAPASINSATPVTKQNEASYFGGNHPCSGTHNRGPARTLIDHYFDGAFTQDPIQSVRTHPGTTANSHPRLTLGLSSRCGVDHDGDNRPRSTPLVECSVEPVLGNSHQSISPHCSRLHTRASLGN